jgi:hypothetical protein
MVSCLAYFSKKKKKKEEEDEDEICFSETFNGLHGVIYQRIELCENLPPEQ